MFQLISIIAVIALIVGGIASAIHYFKEEKAEAQTPPTPTTKAKAPQLTGTRVTVNPQITDSVTSPKGGATVTESKITTTSSSTLSEAPAKKKKKRYYHSKPKASKGNAPARVKSITSDRNLKKVQKRKGN
jgi:hypothetical protein